MVGTHLEVMQQSSAGGGSVCPATTSSLHVCTAASHLRTGTAPQAATSAASAASLSTAFATLTVAPGGGLDGACAAAWKVPGREGDA
eukprot:scaffold14579_cov36-Phaeocystis_antarctica.AAC.1